MQEGFIASCTLFTLCLLSIDNCVGIGAVDADKLVDIINHLFVYY